jgi:hypothetical protein
LEKDSTLSQRCHKQALQFPWSQTARRLQELKNVRGREAA